MKPILVVITGPTASGKTALSIDVARHFGTEILSADSRQLYLEMHIGTAVPEYHELMQVRHHFIHTRSISDYYNASMFEQEVLQTLEGLFQHTRIAVMTGGSMMYIDAVCKGIDDLPIVDPQLRNELIALFEREGIEPLRIQLRLLDPDYYAEVDLQNPKRLLHALEICMMTGKPYSSFRTNTIRERPFHILKIGLNPHRDLLYQRINQRVGNMVEMGLEAEARNLYPQRHNNALNTVGYREWFDCFDGLISREEAIEKIKSNTRRYARKQLTWFRRDKDIRWFEPQQYKEVIPYIEQKKDDLWNRPDSL